MTQKLCSWWWHHQWGKWSEYITREGFIGIKRTCNICGKTEARIA